jgi:hypothetical protein
MKSINEMLEATNGFIDCSRVEQSRKCKSTIETVKTGLLSLSDVYQVFFYLFP